MGGITAFKKEKLMKNIFNINRLNKGGENNMKVKISNKLEIVAMVIQLAAKILKKASK